MQANTAWKNWTVLENFGFSDISISWLGTVWYEWSWTRHSAILREVRLSAVSQFFAKTNFFAKQFFYSLFIRDPDGFNSWRKKMQKTRDTASLSCRLKISDFYECCRSRHFFNIYGDMLVLTNTGICIEIVAAPQRWPHHRSIISAKKFGNIALSAPSIVDLDPYWIRILELSGSGSGSGFPIRIRTWKYYGFYILITLQSVN